MYILMLSKTVQANKINVTYLYLLNKTSTANRQAKNGEGGYDGGQLEIQQYVQIYNGEENHEEMT